MVDMVLLVSLQIKEKGPPPQRTRATLGTPAFFIMWVFLYVLFSLPIDMVSLVKGFCVDHRPRNCFFKARRVFQTIFQWW